MTLTHSFRFRWTQKRACSTHIYLTRSGNNYVRLGTRGYSASAKTEMSVSRSTCELTGLMRHVLKPEEMHRCKSDSSVHPIQW